MKSHMTARLLALAGLIVFSIIGGGRSDAAAPDWKAVEQALGKSGQLQDGGVFRIGMPRTDLNVSVKGVAVNAGSPSGRTPRSSRSATTRWSWAISSCSIRKFPR